MGTDNTFCVFHMIKKKKSCGQMMRWLWRVHSYLSYFTYLRYLSTDFDVCRAELLTPPTAVLPRRLTLAVAKGAPQPNGVISFNYS